MFRCLFDTLIRMFEQSLRVESIPLVDKCQIEIVATTVVCSLIAFEFIAVAVRK